MIIDYGTALVYFPVQSGNRPFPSCLLPLFKNECKCKTFHLKIHLNGLVRKTDFHMKGFALGLETEAKGTRKWPIGKK